MGESYTPKGVYLKTGGSDKLFRIIPASLIGRTRMDICI